MPLHTSLRDVYLNANDRERVTAMLLFGIEHAKELSKFTIAELQDLAVRAGVRKNQASEIRKGVNLAPFVKRQ